MKISNFIVFFGACVLASTVSLRAEEVISNVSTSGSSTEQTEHPKLKGKFKEKMLKKYDKNNDGKLDDAEKAAMKADREERKKQREKKYDTNGDGKLDDAEKAAMKKDLKEKREKHRAERKEKMEEKKEEKPLEQTEAVKTQPTPVSDLGPQTPIPTFPVRGSQ